MIIIIIITITIIIILIIIIAHIEKVALHLQPLKGSSLFYYIFETCRYSTLPTRSQFSKCSRLTIGQHSFFSIFALEAIFNHKILSRIKVKVCRISDGKSVRIRSYSGPHFPTFGLIKTTQSKDCPAHFIQSNS